MKSARGFRGDRRRKASSRERDGIERIQGLDALEVHGNTRTFNTAAHGPRSREPTADLQSCNLANNTPLLAIV